MAHIANITLVILELLGFSISIPERRWHVLEYYTQNSNLVALVSSVAFLLVGEGAAPLRYLATCMLTMTLLVTLFVLVPMGAGFQKMVFGSNCLYHHTLCPLVSVASYVLWEPHASLLVLPVGVTTVYGLVLLWLNARRVVDGPYPFFRVHDQSRAVTLAWTLVLIGVIGAISYCLGKR